MEKTSEKVQRRLALVEEAPSEQFNPDMLTLAREFHGLTINELAERIGFTPSLVSQVESSIKRPSTDFMQRIVSVLKFPHHHYYESGQRESVHPSFYRRRVQVSQTVLRQCAARMTEIKRNITKLLTRVDAIEARIPFIDPHECTGGVKEVAIKMRLHLRIPSGPIRDLTKTLENAGVIIIPFDFGTRKIDACSEWVTDRPVIFVNKLTPASRLRHTLAHELAHLTMHKFITDECESEADYFAAEFNMPEQDIKPELTPMNLDRLARLKLKWKSSMQAILYRAEQLGVITRRTARYHWMLMRRYHYHEVEPHEDMMPIETPSALRELVDVFLNALQFSRESLISFLGVFDEFFDEVYLGKPILKLV